MAELLVLDGTWTFDGEAVRIVPGRERGVHALRQELGEVTVPLAAVAAVAYEPARKGGRLRLRLRDGADPLLQATGGSIPEQANPYALAVEPGSVGVAEYFVDEVRRALTVEQVPDERTDHYLLSGPSVPRTATGVDGVAAFDGARVRVEWRWNASDAKKNAGPLDLAVADLAAVEWWGGAGLESGYLRFRPRGMTLRPAQPDKDPYAVELWGFKKQGGASAVLAAAVAARLPHPYGGAAPADAAAPPADTPPPLPSDAPPPPADGDADPDALLRRLRELGELHRDGTLTDDEFTAAKTAILRRFGP